MTRPSVSASDLKVDTTVSGQGNTNNPSQAEVEQAKREAEAKSAKLDGSGVGLAGSLSVVLGFHF